MVEPISDMPAGTLGFRAHDRLTHEDYRETLIPALHEAVESGEVRLLFVVADDFEKIDFGAHVDDAKADLEFGLSRREVWRRTALVTDVDWMRKALRFFKWLAPGEVRVFAGGEEAAAREWVRG